MLGEKNEREVRPRRLRRDPLHQRPHVLSANGLLGHDSQTRPQYDLSDECDTILADFRVDPGIAQNALREHRVAPVWRQDQCALRKKGWNFPQSDASISGEPDPT
jgi:hypothetical protein